MKPDACYRCRQKTPKLTEITDTATAVAGGYMSEATSRELEGKWLCPPCLALEAHWITVDKLPNFLLNRIGATLERIEVLLSPKPE